MKKKERGRNLTIPVLGLGRDFLVPMTPVHLGDIYLLTVLKSKNYGQRMMYLNTERDNDSFLGVAVLWIYCTVKTRNKNLFQSIFFNANISNDCDEIKSNCQGASQIGTVSVNFLVAWRKILSLLYQNWKGHLVIIALIYQSWIHICLPTCT